MKLEDKWQVIDAFSTKTCIWGEEYDSYANAIDERIEEWIEKDNDGSDDLKTYIADRMPVGARSFVEFSNDVMKTFAKYYTNLDLEDIYEYDSKMLNEEQEF